MGCHSVVRCGDISQQASNNNVHATPRHAATTAATQSETVRHTPPDSSQQHLRHAVAHRVDL